MASGSAAPAALCLQSLPHDVLVRIISAAAFDTAEQLLAAGSLCRCMRAAVGCPSLVQLRPLWTRTIIALVDPTAALAAPADSGLGLEHAYSEHAAFARGWFTLAHALAARNCASCGDVTRFVAWRLPAANGDAGIPLQRCCEACSPAVVHAASGSVDAGEDEETEEDYSHCTIMNAQLFALPVDAHPGLLLDASTLDDPMAALRAALAEASDGDTIRLSGEFASWTFAVNASPDDVAAVRLLGVPAGAPWRSVHMSATAGRHAALTSMAGLNALERVAAAAVGFPSASIFVGRNCLEVYGPVWLENLYISSGNRVADVRQGLIGAPFPAITAFTQQRLGRIVPPSLVLRQCWVTGYNGTAIGLAERVTAALLRCCITNSRCFSVVCRTGSTLRMRGCHALWNGFFMDAGQPPLAAVQRLARANVFVAHPNGHDMPTGVYGILHIDNEGPVMQHVRLLD
jgi:hypothetical protein